LTTGTGLRAVPHDAKAGEGRTRRSCPSQLLCTEEKNTEEVLKYFFWGGGGQPDFRFSQGWRKAMDDYFSIIDLFLGIITSCNYAVMPDGYSFTSLHVTSCTQSRFIGQLSIQHRFNCLSGNIQ